LILNKRNARSITLCGSKLRNGCAYLKSLGRGAE
jgi:hypothetical protein